jgi:hypothetical protein
MRQFTEVGNKNLKDQDEDVASKSDSDRKKAEGRRPGND